jgi:tagatose 1,6-diphosphate aldolase
MEFLDPGELREDELELVLVVRQPEVPPRGWVPGYVFEMRIDGQRVGAIHFRAGTTEILERYSGHIGYGVDPPFRGRRLASRSLRLLLPFIRRHGLATLWITCNPDNLASRRTCELVGAAFVEIVPLPPDNDQYLEGDREKCRYRLDL